MKIVCPQERPETLQSICPFCGYVENVELKYNGYICTCASCGREFKVGDPKWRKMAPRRSVWDVTNRILEHILAVLLSVAILWSAWFFVPKIEKHIKEAQVKRLENQARDKYLEMKQWYNHQLSYHGLVEVASGWDRAGGYSLGLSNGSSYISLYYSTRSDRLEYPCNRIVPGFAMELVRTRILIAKYEAKHKH